jgi:hypothetical protein
VGPAVAQPFRHKQDAQRRASATAPQRRSQGEHLRDGDEPESVDLHTSAIPAPSATIRR